MKKIKLHLIVIFLISLMSCEKEEITQVPIGQAEMWECFQEGNWTEVSFRDELMGKWQWVYTISYWAPNNGINTENEFTFIEFLSDSTLNFIVNGETQLTTKWFVAGQYENMFELQLENAIPNLYGPMLICGEFLEFNNSPVDGADNYYKKIE